MTRVARMAIVLCTAPVVLLAGCGGGRGPSLADQKVCADAADIHLSVTQGGGTWDEQDPATKILGRLSGYAPDDDRLVRAVDHAREDARAVVAAKGYIAIDGNFAALQGSLSAINGVCNDLGT